VSGTNTAIVWNLKSLCESLHPLTLPQQLLFQSDYNSADIMIQITKRKENQTYIFIIHIRGVEHTAIKQISSKLFLVITNHFMFSSLTVFIWYKADMVLIQMPVCHSRQWIIIGIQRYNCSRSTCNMWKVSYHSTDIMDITTGPGVKEICCLLEVPVPLGSESKTPDTWFLTCISLLIIFRMSWG